MIGAGEHGIRVAERGSYSFMDVEIGQSIIRDNPIAQRETGLYVGPGSGVLVQGNLIHGGDVGMVLNGSRFAVVGNRYYLMGPPTAPAAGLLLGNTAGVAVRDNVFLGNDTGAMLAYSLGDTLLDNTGAGNTDHWATTAGATWNDNGDNYATP